MNIQNFSKIAIAIRITGDFITYHGRASPSRVGAAG
jgi:hypothetical protein